MRAARRQRTLWIVCALALLALGSVCARHTLAASDAWEHDETVDGIALYTREVQAHGYDVVKGVATLDVRMEVLIGLLRDIERFPRWYHDCKRTRVLERPRALLPVRVRADGRVELAAGDESYVLLFVQDSSPLEDRWAVVQNTVRIEKSGAVSIEFRSLDARAHAAPEGAVRMRLRGRWLLEPLARARTRVSFELDVDPNTSTPAFLVDPRLHDVPLETLRKLRRVAREPRALELGRAALTPP